MINVKKLWCTQTLITFEAIRLKKSEKCRLANIQIVDKRQSEKDKFEKVISF